ncbi:BrnT family toxin [bacterium]|nr:BrnT family toxin [bacterium]
MEFEYDPNKSKSNEQKHGISFEESKSLWLDFSRLEVQAKSDDEPRYALIASLNHKLWTAFYIIREERIRIISVRRSRKGERRLYYES